MSEKSKVTDEIPTPAAIGLSVFIIGLSVVVGVATDTLLIASISFGINWLEFFVYAWPFRSEKYNDLTGTISCTVVDVLALLYYEGTLTNIPKYYYILFNKSRSRFNLTCSVEL